MVSFDELSLPHFKSLRERGQSVLHSWLTLFHKMQAHPAGRRGILRNDVCIYLCGVLYTHLVSRDANRRKPTQPDKALPTFTKLFPPQL